MKKYYIHTNNKQEILSLVSNVLDEKPTHPTFFSAECTDIEIKNLKLNSDVLKIESFDELIEVEDATRSINSIGRTSTPYATGSYQGNGNWGLIRHTNDSNPFPLMDSTASYTYTYNYDGDGVDMIFLSAAMVDVDNAEYKTGGVSRIQQYQWNTLSNMSGMETIDYSSSASTSNHAEGVLALACSNTYGWATGARIYIIPRDQVSDSTHYFDAAKEFHKAKVNAGGTVRPTVFFASYGYAGSSTTQSERNINFRGNDFTEYKGVPLTVRVAENFGGASMLEMGCHPQFKSGYSETYLDKNSIGQAAQDLEDEGVITIYSAGNEAQKCDYPSGADWNNHFTNTNVSSDFYYNRGSAQWANNSIVVANLSSRFNTITSGKEELYTSSNRGDRVDCAAAGNVIRLTIPSGDVTVSGTSYSCPQIAGMVALVLEKYPSTTPYQMRKFFREEAISSSTLQTGKSTLTTDLGSYGDPEYFNNGLNLQGYSGNITYLDPTIPFDPTTYGSGTISYTAPSTESQRINFTIDQIKTKLASI